MKNRVWTTMRCDKDIRYLTLQSFRSSAHVICVHAYSEACNCMLYASQVLTKSSLFCIILEWVSKSFSCVKFSWNLKKACGCLARLSPSSKLNCFFLLLSIHQHKRTPLSFIPFFSFQASLLSFVASFSHKLLTAETANCQKLLTAEVQNCCDEFQMWTNVLL